MQLVIAEGREGAVARRRFGTDDRWWSVPAFSAVMAGKHGSILEETNAIPFDEWWEEAVEVDKASEK